MGNKNEMNRCRPEHNQAEDSGLLLGLARSFFFAFGSSRVLHYVRRRGQIAPPDIFKLFVEDHLTVSGQAGRWLEWIRRHGRLSREPVRWKNAQSPDR